jgi:simple sugar transport system ATP-binding protein
VESAWFIRSLCSCPGFSVTENIKLNREILNSTFLSKLLGPRLKKLDMNKMKQDSRKALDSLGIDIADSTLIAGMPVGYMQFVEIAREIDKENMKLLIFDEPTAVLTEGEADRLLDTMEKLSAKGIAILFITHRLDEVMKVAHTVTVLRDGSLVDTLNKSDVTVERIAEMMVGRKIEQLKRAASVNETHETIMEIKNLKVSMPGERVKNFGIDIKRGEILGIGGLAGQGKIGIANGIMGLYKCMGEVLVDGKKMELNNPQYAIKSNLAFVSEDRRGVGLLLDTSIELNIAMTSMQIQNKFLKNLKGINFIQLKDTKEIRRHAEKMIKDLDIRCTGPKQKTKSLSGGNQQKVCVARALVLGAKILFVSEPTRGIDIGAKKLILELLVKLNQELGITIVVTSSELAELRSVCDRIAIIYNGQLEGVLKPTDSDLDFGLMMAGEYKSYHGEAIG